MQILGPTQHDALESVIARVCSTAQHAGEQQPLNKWDMPDYTSEQRLPQMPPFITVPCLPRMWGSCWL